MHLQTDMDETDRQILAQHRAEIVAEERERCAKIAEEYGKAAEKGGPVSSTAEDYWSASAAFAIAKRIRGGK